MKVLILNGSPRKNGNTAHALNAIKTGLEQAGHTVESLAAVDLKLRGCIACDGCKKNGGRCVLPDDGAMLIGKVNDSDLILFGSPVYWWGISGQLKLALDKFYSNDVAYHTMKKKLGIVAIGEADLSDPEYRLISEQFQCMARFLGWDLVLDQAISACGVEDLAKSPSKLAELSRLGASL